MQIKANISKSDIDEIYNISKEQFGENSWTYEQFIDSYYSKSTQVYVAIENLTIVSFMIVQDNIDDLNILLIATKENYKRKGYAKNLLNLLGSKTIWLEVRESNFDAINFYLANEFKLIGKRLKYYKNKENALIFEKKVLHKYS